MAVDAPRIGLVVLSLLAGAIVGGLFVSDGAPFAGGGARPILVRVVNDGANPAAIFLTATLHEAGRTISQSDTLRPGAEADVELGRVEGQVSLRLRVEWAFGASTGSAERGALVEEGQCPAGRTSLVVMPFRVQQGASFDTPRRDCL